MEKQKLLYQQARLHDRGAAEMVLQTISASKGTVGSSPHSFLLNSFGFNNRFCIINKIISTLPVHDGITPLFCHHVVQTWDMHYNNIVELICSFVRL